VISKTDVKCIYSGRTLEPGFSLDHFIPWSLVAHDQLWNLIPVDPIANSRKCDKLPSAKYLQQLTKAHAQALNLWKKTHAEPEWQKIVTEYTQDLRFQSEDDLLDEPKLSANLSENLGLLLELGKRQGFESDWEYR
jgi:CRISPR/Cas system Type II protein with McrA/HNH and RuvC-like nuclease domain